VMKSVTVLFPGTRKSVAKAVAGISLVDGSQFWPRYECL